MGSFFLEEDKGEFLLFQFLVVRSGADFESRSFSFQLVLVLVLPARRSSFQELHLTEVSSLFFLRPFVSSSAAVVHRQLVDLPSLKLTRISRFCDAFPLPADLFVPTLGITSSLWLSNLFGRRNSAAGEED